MVRETQVDICKKCGQPFENPNGIFSKCKDCWGTGNKPVQQKTSDDWQEGLERGEPLDIAFQLLKAKYLDENLKNVLYGQEDPVAEPVAEEPPHPASIEGDVETSAQQDKLDRLRERYVKVMLDPQSAFRVGMNPHGYQNKIDRLERELEDRKRQGMTAWTHRNHHIIGPFPTWTDYDTQPQKENEEARANTPDLVRWGEPLDIAFQLLKEEMDLEPDEDEKKPKGMMMIRISAKPKKDDEPATGEEESDTDIGDSFDGPDAEPHKDGLNMAMKLIQALMGHD